MKVVRRRLQRVTSAGPKARRSTYLSVILCLPQSVDLPDVVEAVYQMKLPQLTCVQRTQDGMIQQFHSRAPLLFAIRDYLVQLCDLRNNSIAHGFRRQPSPLGGRRTFTPFWQEAEIDRNQNSAAMPHR